MSSNQLAVAEQLGRLSATLDKMETGRVEAAARAKEDRDRTEASISRLESALDGLRYSTDAMQQTLRSTSDQVVKLALDKCGERLDKLEGTILSDDFKESTTRLGRLEETIGRWQRWMGTGLSFVARLVIAVMASGAIAGTVAAFAAKVAAHF